VSGRLHALVHSLWSLQKAGVRPLRAARPLLVVPEDEQTDEQKEENEEESVEKPHRPRPKPDSQPPVASARLRPTAADLVDAGLELSEDEQE
jgi:hypothetical protein